ncbi:MAG: MarR family transcriptional regulator [Pseudobutyrivibrio sp.]|nr:MarR family transcriptional regulator [Pseudobutyrivibrio sp.]
MKVKMHDLNMILEGTDALYHEASKKLGLSDAQMCILYNIYEHGDGCPQKELYKSTGISKSTINSAIKNMEREGYVALKAIDGRSTGIYVTQKGHNLMADTVEKLIEIENRVFDSWSEEERKLIVKLNRDFMDKFAQLVKEL